MPFLLRAPEVCGGPRSVTGPACNLLGKEIFLTGRLFYLIDPPQIPARKKATDPITSPNKYVLSVPLPISQ